MHPKKTPQERAEACLRRVEKLERELLDAMAEGSYDKTVADLGKMVDAVEKSDA